jgi:hypothetical protein
MSERYDVIRLDNGAPMWVAASDNFEDAKKLAKECTVKYSSDCWVYDQFTGVKHVVKHDGSVHAENT